MLVFARLRLGWPVPGKPMAPGMACAPRRGWPVLQWRLCSNSTGDGFCFNCAMTSPQASVPPPTISKVPPLAQHGPSYYHDHKQAYHHFPGATVQPQAGTFAEEAHTVLLPTHGVHEACIQEVLLEALETRWRRAGHKRRRAGHRGRAGTEAGQGTGAGQGAETRRAQRHTFSRTTDALETRRAQRHKGAQSTRVCVLKCIRVYSHIRTRPPSRKLVNIHNTHR